ncbi:DUF559 domain-containing protein [Pedobacter sp. Leaf250]|uniref:DUF559 domain-containing protein n=1 Tax=Pedobacter sp. Leaf250 TaxID=2876559 RepID=UPI001E588C18|nr:DUF559 domain-containing protein [Pedobacter sp. Leaf250]
MQRDQEINELLSSKGYTVMRFWEHQVKEKPTLCVNQVTLFIEAAKIDVIPTLND